MPKLATPSPERAQLVAAHQELAAAQHAHAEAEVDYEQARSAGAGGRAVSRN